MIQIRIIDNIYVSCISIKWGYQQVIHKAEQDVGVDLAGILRMEECKIL